jgi:hypothetical protein
MNRIVNTPPEEHPRKSDGTRVKMVTLVELTDYSIAPKRLGYARDHRLRANLPAATVSARRENPLRAAIRRSPRRWLEWGEKM